MPGDEDVRTAGPAAVSAPPQPPLLQAEGPPPGPLPGGPPPRPRPPRPRPPRTPPEPPLRRARRMLLAREHRKVVLLGTVGLVLVLVLGVYSAFSGKAEQVEGVVQFTATATQAQKAAVRTACPTVGKAVLEPAEHSTLATVLTYPVRYDLTQASAAEQAAIYKCVNTQPGVIGVGLVRQGD